MNVSTELLEGNKAKLTVEVPAEALGKALNRVYNKQKGRISIPGFRKGKAPRKIIEKMYGKEIFYQDAADDLVSEYYPKAYDECEEDIVSRPDIEATQLEEGKPFIFTAVVALRPEVKLAQYKGVEVTKVDLAVSEEDIDEEIERQLKDNARFVNVEGEAEEGDTANIDYEGFVDGESFEGGTGEDFDLELGSNTFIPGFEDQLIGASAGDEVQVNVTFPEEYHAPDLAGKDAVFIVKVNEIRREEVPELDEEYVGDIGFDSIEEYRDDVRSTLEKRKEDDKKRRQEDEAISAIAEASEIEVPEEMIDTQVTSALNDYASNMARSGISFSQYMKMTGMTVEKMKEQLRPDTVSRIRASLVLEEIAKAEDLKASDEDVTEKLEMTASRYNMKVEDIRKDMTDKDLESLKNQIAMEKAVELVLANVTEVDKPQDDPEEEE